MGRRTEHNAHKRCDPGQKGACGNGGSKDCHRFHGKGGEPSDIGHGKAHDKKSARGSHYLAHAPNHSHRRPVPRNSGSPGGTGLSFRGRRDRQLGSGVGGCDEKIPNGAVARFHRQDRLALADRVGARSQARQLGLSVTRRRRQPSSGSRTQQLSKKPEGNSRRVSAARLQHKHDRWLSCIGSKLHVTVAALFRREGRLSELIIPVVRGGEKRSSPQRSGARLIKKPEGNRRPASAARLPHKHDRWLSFI